MPISMIRMEVNGAPVAYCRGKWGECISGTKTQLQTLGLGVGRAFPGEAQGPRRVLNVRDPRGFKAQIEVNRDPTEPYPYVTFVNFPKPPEVEALYQWAPWRAVAVGVQKQERTATDLYAGSPEDLVAAGLVRAEHLPGAPGMGGRSVVVWSDGRAIAGRAPALRLFHEGCKRVERVLASILHVQVWVSEGEQRRRLIVWKDTVAKVDRHVQKAYPAPLQPTVDVAGLALAARSAADDVKFRGFLDGLLAGAAAAPRRGRVTR